MRVPRLGEWILIVLILAAGGSLMYKLTQKSSYERIAQESKKAVREIQEIRSFKNLWEKPNIPSRIRAAVDLLPQKKLQEFDLRHHRVKIKIENLQARELNRFLGVLFSLPLQIQFFKLERSKDGYGVECQCIWL